MEQNSSICHFDCPLANILVIGKTPINMFDGTIYTRHLEGWQITWESQGDHRFWCLQTHPSNLRLALVIMFNPGSLEGRGMSLSKDDTLRTLRSMFRGSSYNMLVINLFSLATVEPSQLFARWGEHDHPRFSFNALPIRSCSAVMYAYGDYENGGEYAMQIRARIVAVRSVVPDLREIVVPRNIVGTPMHPRRAKWKKLQGVFGAAITHQASYDQRFLLALPEGASFTEVVD